MRLNIHGLIDNARCYEMVRHRSWKEQVECPHCHAPENIKNGHDRTQPDRQRYLCRMCNRSFNDLIYGRCYGVGYVFVVVFLKSGCRCLWAFFQFVHNVRRQGQARLRSLEEALVATNPETE